jgi:hypothetical protein
MHGAVVGGNFHHWKNWQKQTLAHRGVGVKGFILAPFPLIDGTVKFIGFSKRECTQHLEPHCLSISFNVVGNYSYICFLLRIVSQHVFKK